MAFNQTGEISLLTALGEQLEVLDESFEIVVRPGCRPA